MDSKKAIEKIEESEGFKEWRRQHKDAFLVHVFTIIDAKESWQVGYYDNKMMYVFSLDDIAISETDEVLKSEHGITELDIDGVMIPDSDALENAKKVAKENYPSEMIMKTFIILQNISKEPVFNLTFFTRSFKTINIKLSAKDNSLKSKSIDKLFDFG